MPCAAQKVCLWKNGYSPKKLLLEAFPLLFTFHTKSVTLCFATKCHQKALIPTLVRPLFTNSIDLTQYDAPGGHVCTRFLIQGTAFNSWRGFVFYSDWYRRFVLSRKQTSQNRFWCWDDTDKHRYIQEKTKCTLIKGCAISFNSTAIRDALLNTCMLKFMLQSRTVMKSSSICQVVINHFGKWISLLMDLCVST